MKKKMTEKAMEMCFEIKVGLISFWFAHIFHGAIKWYVTVNCVDLCVMKCLKCMQVLVCVCVSVVECVFWFMWIVCERVAKLLIDIMYVSFFHCLTFFFSFSFVTHFFETERNYFLLLISDHQLHVILFLFQLFLHVHTNFLLNMCVCVCAFFKYNIISNFVFLSFFF